MLSLPVAPVVRKKVCCYYASIGASMLTGSELRYSDKKKYAAVQELSRSENDYRTNSTTKSFFFYCIFGALYWVHFFKFRFENPPFETRYLLSSSFSFTSLHFTPFNFVTRLFCVCFVSFSFRFVSFCVVSFRFDSFRVVFFFFFRLGQNRRTSRTRTTFSSRWFSFSE